MRSSILVLIACCFVIASEVAAEECMDCGEKRTQRFTASGQQLWPERSDALCCKFPCWDDKYVVRQEDVGWGCLTCTVQNEFVTGTICCSSSADLGCADSGGGGDGWGGGFNDGSGCIRDSSGACPPECTSCT
jgi:hypothetical protein